MKKSKLKIAVFELVWYIIQGLVGLWGLTYIVLGIVESFLPAKSLLSKANDTFTKTFGLSFFNWGLIILAAAVLLTIIVLLVYASKVDRLVEKQQRRAARLSHSKVVEAEVEVKE